ncbi:MAG: sugar phosphate isomerase/epimerase [Planctomycetales bacterium]|jgi:sugar phosphate isomerase/epimerase|nr:sugar phosphate isomerase/epimerase [Planctomycetales bacterium]
MPQFRLAIATRCFRQSLQTSFKSASGLNATGVQLDLNNEVSALSLSDTGRRHLLHHISELNLSVAGATFPLKHPLTEETELDRRVSSLRDAMTFAYSLKATTLCCRVGRIPSDHASKSRQLLVEILSDLARHGNHVGTILCITPTDDSAEDLLALISEIKTGPVGVDFDPAHFTMTGRSSADALRTLHAVTSHVQLRDGLRDFSGGSQEAAIGQGAVDWPEVFALLNEMDYRGWLTVIRTQGDDRIGDMSRAITFVRNLLPGI